MMIAFAVEWSGANNDWMKQQVPFLLRLQHWRLQLFADSFLYDEHVEDSLFFFSMSFTTILMEMARCSSCDTFTEASSSELILLFICQSFHSFSPFRLFFKWNAICEWIFRHLLSREYSKLWIFLWWRRYNALSSNNSCLFLVDLASNFFLPGFVPEPRSVLN